MPTLDSIGLCDFIVISSEAVSYRAICIRVIYGLQCRMEVKHGAGKKVRWEFYEGERDPW